MAVTNQQIVDFLLANPGLTDAQIAATMQEYNVTPAQMAAAVNVPVSDVESRYNAALPFVNPVIEERVIDMGDGTRSEYYIKGTNIQADAPTFSEVAPTTGLTESSAPQYQANNFTIYDPQAKGEYVYNPQGQLVGFNPGERSSSIGGFLNEVYQDNKNVINSALLFGALDAAGLLGGGAGTTGVTGANGAFLGEGALSGIAASDAALAGATVGSTGLTMAELAQLDMALGGAGGTTGATQLANALMTGASIPTITALTGGSGAGLLSNISNTLGGVTSTLGGGTGATTGATTLGTGGATGALTTGATTSAAKGATGALTTGLTNAMTNTGVSTAVNSLLGNKNLPNLLSGALGTTGNLLQMQTSKEAAQRAQAMIDAETAAAKASAQFRPVGMTTRFGTSQFQVDPVTGQITSAGYTLSPEAKYAQDKLVAQANLGLQQIEQAQQQFAPLQTGAQNLFNLGNQYIAQSPEQVAQNYMNQQLALLQPGRELELANLQNKLQQQGRGGLSVAQGGNLGATTPELQALFNARAQQEAQLAAQAQQAGQQQVTFGAGLLGQGANAMGQYYGGQTAAYQPYTTALGQVQNLEAAAQQPFAMGASLGQQASTAGARVGALGLEGANISQRLATGANATTNPFAQLLGAAGNPNAMFGSTINSMLGGLFGTTPVNALDSSAYGTGTTGFQNMLNDIYG